MGTFYPTNDYRSYLSHHGVKGMKWGVRKQYYADIKKRRKLGRAATIADHSVAVAEYKINKIKKKIEKHGVKEKYVRDLDTNKWIKKNLTKKRNAYEKALHAQVSSMKKAYGTKIKDVNYNKYGRVNENVIRGKDVLAAGLTSAVVNGAFFAAGLTPLAAAVPSMGFAAIPSTTKIKESDYNTMLRNSYSEERRNEAVKTMYEELNELKRN